MESTYIARCAQLAMLLEVSATPKPGNIDRNHDYEDTRFEHFLASAVGVYPVFEKAARSDSGVGMFIHEAVVESSRWQRGGNTHFGAFILLIPLVMAAGRCESKACLRDKAMQVVKATTIEDAVELYRAFPQAKVKVRHVNELDLNNPSSINRIRQLKLTLFDIMKLSSSYDIIAEEWVNGFQKSFECADMIQDNLKKHCINDAVVLTFMKLLSSNKDSFIQTKFGSEKAEVVSRRAENILKRDEIPKIMEEIHSFDIELLKEGVNPGSTADIIIAGLFVLLTEGMRF